MHKINLMIVTLRVEKQVWHYVILRTLQIGSLDGHWVVLLTRFDSSCSHDRDSWSGRVFIQLKYDHHLPSARRVSNGWTGLVPNRPFHPHMLQKQKCLSNQELPPMCWVHLCHWVVLLHLPRPKSSCSLSWKLLDFPWETFDMFRRSQELLFELCVCMQCHI